MRRTALAICLVALAAGALGAPDTGAEKAAATASEKWLAAVDAGKYGESYDAAAALFRKALTRAQWEDALGKVRGPLGKVVSRKLHSSEFTTTLPGAPAGEYVVIQYATDFENRKGMTETVTPMKDPDGTWRVSGYYIK